MKQENKAHTKKLEELVSGEEKNETTPPNWEKKYPISLHDECHINEFKVDRSGAFVAELWCEPHKDAKKIQI
ncbi:unnamed protein product [Trifolium pratense]|uniref:Uncharacterized protein n=1 Tax=Trifolium pratense TaxID=57577 RepID=A0ACB0LDI4_TRIPR|nr:unnamed protein product [Trifolium pratense]